MLATRFYNFDYKGERNENGSLTLPNTLAIMEQASNGGGGTSIFPIVPITTK